MLGFLFSSALLISNGTQKIIPKQKTRKSTLLLDIEKAKMKKLIAKNIPDSQIRDLAAAICIQAALDYKTAIRKGQWFMTEIGQGKGRKKITIRVFKVKLLKEWRTAAAVGLAEPEEYERFFHSSWFQSLCGIMNGDKAVEYLKKTMNDAVVERPL